MIRWFADRIMYRRGRRLIFRMDPFLRQVDQILDIGSGTGHHGVLIRQAYQVPVTGMDVEDLSWVGPAPQITQPAAPFPFSDCAFDCSLIAYVLQYVDDPVAFLKEAKRVTDDMVIIVQSGHAAADGSLFLRVQEFCFGPLAFLLARAVGLIRAGRCSVVPCRYFTNDEMIRLIEQSGMMCVHKECRQQWLTGCWSCLYVCTADMADAG